MDDLISRQAAIDVVTAWLHKALNPLNRSEYNAGEIAAYETALSELKKIPSAQPTIEPRKGKWIYNKERGTAKIWTCSECGWNDIGEWNFCPNCGADMRGEEE